MDETDKTIEDTFTNDENQKETKIKITYNKEGKNFNLKTLTVGGKDIDGEFLTRIKLKLAGAVNPYTQPDRKALTEMLGYTKDAINKHFKLTIFINKIVKEKEKENPNWLSFKKSSKKSLKTKKSKKSLKTKKIKKSL